jgi:hypothetical protein
MQPAELVELATLAAFHGPTLVVGATGSSLVGLEDYWSASKCRFDRWGTALGRLRRNEYPLFDDCSGNACGLIEEILGSEVLVRIWTAVVTLFDRHRNVQDNEIVVRSVYIGHLELRRRALKLLFGGAGLTSTEAVALNRLRHRLEQWTDMLLAPLAVGDDVKEFAFEEDRLRAQAAELKNDQSGEKSAFLQTTIRTFAARAFAESAPCPDLNVRVATAVLGGFAPELFDSCGTLRSLWMMRLTKIADDTQRLVTELFRSEREPFDPHAPTPRF